MGSAGAAVAVGSAGAADATTPSDAADASAPLGLPGPFPHSRAPLSWDDFFIALCFLAAQRSRDPNTQVGAVVVNDQHVVVGLGYNGFPRGVPDGALPWAREAPPGGSSLDTKYPYVVHAEVNAVLNTASSARGCVLFVALFPCAECAKVIIQSGIVEVVYADDKYAGVETFVASRRLLALAGVRVRHHAPAAAEITLKFR